MSISNVLLVRIADSTPILFTDQFELVSQLLGGHLEFGGGALPMQVVEVDFDTLEVRDVSRGIAREAMRHALTLDRALTAGALAFLDKHYVGDE